MVILDFNINITPL